MLTPGGAAPLGLDMLDTAWLLEQRIVERTYLVSGGTASELEPRNGFGLFAVGVEDAVQD